MKRLNVIALVGIIILFALTNVHGQKSVAVPKTTTIEPYSLSITFNKTTNLIFPYTIKSVDRGSRDILAQKAKGLENILLVKAGKENFTETNLSVITSDGKLYSFLLNYSDCPSQLNIAFTKDTVTEKASPIVQPGLIDAQIEWTAKSVAHEKRMLHGKQHSRYDMRLRLNGIYIKNDVFYFQLEVGNRSHINFDIDLLRFFIKDQKKYKRTASQELEQPPLYLYGDTAVVKEQSKKMLVVALPKFTIPDQKVLGIQLMERNGGRHLLLNVHNRTLLKARPVNE